MTLLYQSPVGTEAERNAGLIWPGTWRDANPYGSYYELTAGTFAYHTGADLNLPNNADGGAECYAVADGKVIFAERVCGSTWGNMIVILHDDGVCSRYAHLRAFYVYKGQRVQLGQPLGVIGGVGKTLDQFSDHLHFDLSTSGKLVTDPTYWPGTDLVGLKRHFVDPARFLRGELPTTPEQPTTDTLQTTDALNVRAAPGLAQTVLRVLPKGDVIKVGQAVEKDSLTWRALASTPGWVAAKFLTPNISIPPLPPQPPPTSGATVGIHVAGSGDIGDLFGVVERSAKRGTPVPFMVVVNDRGIVETVKRLSPKTVVVFRGGIGEGDPSPYDEKGNGDGAGWFERYYHSYHAGVPADYHQLYNEVSFGGNMPHMNDSERVAYARNAAQVDIAMMRRADAVGVKLAIGNYMPGVPDPTIFGDALKPVYEHAAKNGHAALFHWYSDPKADEMVTGAEYMCFRLLRYFQQWPNLPVLVGEMSVYESPRFRGPASMVRTWIDAARLVKPFRTAGMKLLIASWTIRGQTDSRWKLDDWTPMLGEYEANLAVGKL